MPNDTKPNEPVVIPTQEQLLNIMDGETPVTEEPEVIAPENSTPQLSEVEQAAVAQGWTTKEEWVNSGRDAKDWRPADVWLDRGEFFREIRALKQKNQSLEAQVAESYQTGRKLAEAQFKKELDELRAARRVALDEGDAATAIKIQDVIEEKKEAAEASMPKQASQQFAPPPEYNIFTQRNPWYTTDRVLTHTADAIGFEFKRMNPNATAADLYWHVEQEMIKNFPKLRPQGSAQPADKLPPMEGSRQVTKGGKTEGESLSAVEKGMSQMERDIMNTLIKTKSYKGTKEDYLKEYAKAR